MCPWPLTFDLDLQSQPSLGQGHPPTLPSTSSVLSQVKLTHGSWHAGMEIAKGSDWIRLLFAHLFPLNSRDAIASAHFILGCFTTYASWLLHFSCEPPTRETKGWAQSSPFPARLFSDLSFGQVPKKNATWRWSEPTCQCFRDSQLAANNIPYYRHLAHLL